MSGNLLGGSSAGIVNVQLGAGLTLVAGVLSASAPAGGTPGPAGPVGPTGPPGSANSITALTGAVTAFGPGSANSGFTAGTTGTGAVVLAKSPAIHGTTTNDNAAAGVIGEYISADVVTPGSSQTSGAVGDIASIALTAGDWDVEGVIVFQPAGGTLATAYEAWVNNASATPPAQEFRSVQQISFAAGAGQNLAAPRRRFSLAASGTIYLSCYLTFSISTMTAYGQVSARRVR
jgi:hypothetical protein